MKKGSEARRCRCCKKIVAWKVPSGESVLGISLAEMRFLPDGLTDGKGYICKACKKKEEAYK